MMADIKVIGPPLAELRECAGQKHAKPEFRLQGKGAGENREFLAVITGVNVGLGEQGRTIIRGHEYGNAFKAFVLPHYYEGNGQGVCTIPEEEIHHWLYLTPAAEVRALQHALQILADEP
jgi:hypothetical protein